MAGPALPGDHDRARLRRRSDRITLCRRVLVPVTRVAAPGYEALGRHVVGAPTSREAVLGRAGVWAETAVEHGDLVRAVHARAHQQLVDRWRRREGPTHSVGADQHGSGPGLPRRRGRRTAARWRGARPKMQEHGGPSMHTTKWPQLSQARQHGSGTDELAIVYP